MSQRAVFLHLPKSNPITIEFKDVTYSVSVPRSKEKKQILQGVSGKFQPRELTAIMGPSGAGKSTLLNILTGFHSSGMGGWILSNGEVRKKQRPSSNTSTFRKESAYIMQDDQLWPLFTVLEVMNMSANLKLGFSLSTKAKHLVIDDILDTLGLNGTRTVACKDLSGGQKKKLSIALEMVDNPPVMFLDEPTTGLDSLSSLQCITMLKALARGGRTVVCTIHQPSATMLEMFDHVYMLAEGVCAYQGSSDNLVPFLSSVGLNCPQYHNPADYILEIASGEYGHFIQELAVATTSKCWRKHDELTGSVSEEQVTEEDEKTDSTKTMILIDTPSEYTKFWVLLYRCFVLLYRDWTITHLKCVVHILVGVLLGLNYLNIGSDGSKTINNLGYMVVTITYLMFTSMMPAVLRFPTELAVLKKERFNNWYYLRTYYLAFMVSNCPIQMLYCVLHTSVSYLLTAQPLNIERFAMFMLSCLLITLIGESIGLLLGTLCNPVNGTFLGSIYICFMLLFSGFLILFNHMSNYMYWMSYLSAFRYTTMGMFLSLYDFGRDGLPCPEDITYCHLRSPRLILKEFGVTAGHYWVNIGALVGLLILFRVTTFCTLRRCIKSC